MTDLAVVMVPRDRLSMFPRCLATLYANTPVPFRLIVVTQRADTQTQESARHLQTLGHDVHVVLTEHLPTQSEARNLALRQVHERWCVMLENDTMVHRHWFPPLLTCAVEEGAAVVMPLILWYRGIHAAGCMFEERPDNGAIAFSHRILYSDIRRKRIDYPESHCLLIDRLVLPDSELFDEVEPFDVDFGLTLRRRHLSAFIEPGAVTTYDAPPPLEARDVPLYRIRWDPRTWETRNRQFMHKWGVVYDSADKRASYRRQQLKLGLARWYPTAMSVGVSNFAISIANRLASAAQKRHTTCQSADRSGAGRVP